jgi:hypothetical protein
LKWKRSREYSGSEKVRRVQWPGKGLESAVTGILDTLPKQSQNGTKCDTLHAIDGDLVGDKGVLKYYGEWLH